MGDDILFDVGQLLRTSPPELVVHDKTGTCPYLPGRVSRLPLRYPIRTLNRGEMSERLAAGDRREGKLLYRPQCPSCLECIPIRLNVETFKPNKTQRRTLRRTGAAVRVEQNPLSVDERRVELYNAHRVGRGLGDSSHRVEREHYELMFVETCCESFELNYWHDNKLIGVAIVDRAEDALSAVYSYYDPEYQQLSLGTFSVLRQMQLLKKLGLRYLYLGFLVADNDHMRYKSKFTPHEKLVDGDWITRGG